MIKVSVVVPIYNVEKYLSECIESVLNQSLSELELILVNDGSPDDCDAICKKYADTDKRITYVSQVNQGVSVARNMGISIAKGEYVFILDSDDTIDKEFLTTSYDVAIKNNSEIVVIGEWFLTKGLSEISALPIMATMIKNAFLKKYPNIRFPVGIQPCEDGLFSHQLLALTDKISGNPLGIYHYRQHFEQNHFTINSNCEKVLHQIPQWFDILSDFYTKYDLWNLKSDHLARFVDVEPWGLRLQLMPFDVKQQEILLKLIKNFMNDKVLTHLEQDDYKKLSIEFRIFLKSRSASAAFAKIKRRESRIQHMHNLRIFLINLIPIKKYRKQLRKREKQRFN